MWRAASLCAALLLCTASWAADKRFSGAGSSAAKPLYNKMADAYFQQGGATLDYKAIGSSAGLARVKEQSVDFGASDVAVSTDDPAKEKLICFPSAISGVVPVIHLPGIKNGELRLTAELLSGIFARKLRHWDDPALVAANPRLALPHLPITLVVRQDGSGSTYNFTDYLSKVSPEWQRSHGRGFTVAWHADAVAVKGSGEVVTALRQKPGAISYIDYQYVLQEKLTYPKLRNADGQFVAPGGGSFAAALKNSGWETTARYEEMLTNKPGAASWPITMGTFVIVPRTAANPERTKAALKFFTWGFMHGDTVFESANFVRLPDKVIGRIYGEMTKVTDSQGRPLDWSLTTLVDLRH